MPDDHSTTPPDAANRWFSTLGSLLVGAAFLALWLWLLPGWLGFDVAARATARWRWLAAIPSALGFAVAIRCIWDFGYTGRGTPAPMVPPSRLVVVGFYRYVRNPMYVGFAAGWIGLWIIFGHANPRVIAAVAAAALAAPLRPLLRRAHAAPQIRPRLRGVLPKRPSLVPPPPSLDATALAHMECSGSPPPSYAEARLSGDAPIQSPVSGFLVSDLPSSVRRDLRFAPAPSPLFDVYTGSNVQCYCLRRRDHEEVEVFHLGDDGPSRLSTRPG